LRTVQRFDAELEALRGCRIIEAGLRIGGSVSSVEPLEHLDQLTIHTTEALVDLRGLELLRSTGSLELVENAALQTLEVWVATGPAVAQNRHGTVALEPACLAAEAPVSRLGVCAWLA
jgi:hypothetical protein